MRWIVAIALLLAFAGVGHAADELPAAGASLTLKPTPSGYEARMNLPPKKFVGARISSTDSILAPLLQMKEWKEDADPAHASAPPANGTPLKVLTVTLASGQIPQGQYPVSLSLIGGDAPETRDFFLVVPAAKVDPIETLVVYRDLWGGDIVGNQPQILESSSKQWLTGLSFLQRGNTDAGAEPAGRLQMKGKIADLAPGGSGLIVLNRDYALAGDFPLGVAKGKLVLKADQLADSVNFGFEIHSRIWFVWMFVPMALGLLLAWASRTWLTGRVNLAREKEKPFALLELIDAGLARNADGQFQDAAREARDQATRATERRTADEVRAATTDAQHTYDAAVAALADRRSAFDKALMEFRALVETPYRSLTVAERALSFARQGLDNGLEGLATNDVAAASRALAAARGGLAGAVARASQSWERSMTDLATAIDGMACVAGPAATADITKALRSVVDSVSQKRPQLEMPEPKAEALKAALGALHSGLYSVESLLNQLAAAIEQEITHATRALGRSSLPDDAAWRKWPTAARERVATLAKLDLADPEQLVASLQATDWDLAPQVVAAFSAQLDGQDKAEVDQLAAALAQGGPSAAATKLSELLEAAQVKTPKGAAVAAAAAPGPSPIEISKAPVQLPAVQPPRASLAYLEVSRDGFSPTNLLAGFNRRRIETSGWMLTGIYAAVIAVGGYFLFAGKWTGTPADFAAVFFWAYAIDIGADAAVNAAKAVRT